MSAYARFGILTLISLYLLILIGGIVRSTGSGMGCPDWPKCFGKWIPPTEESTLPFNYREIYREKRLQKNERIASMLDKMGFASTAYTLRHDPRIAEEEPFNAVKTWIEYVNRLFGVLVGLFVLASAVLSLAWWNKDRIVTVLTVVSLFLTVFQAWLGSIVVSANLLPGTITLHMALALIMTLTLGYAVYRTLPLSDQRIDAASLGLIRPGLVLVFMGLTFLQVLLGTQVRQEVDALFHQFGLAERFNIPNRLDALDLFVVHRSASWILLGLAFGMFRAAKAQHQAAPFVYQTAKALIFAVVLAFGTGVSLYRLGFGAWAQPLHLFFASVITGLAGLLWLQVRNPEKTQTASR